MTHFVVLARAGVVFSGSYRRAVRGSGVRSYHLSSAHLAVVVCLALVLVQCHACVATPER